jgi:hypothetical protein
MYQDPPEFDTPIAGALYLHQQFSFKMLPLWPNSKRALQTGWPENSLKLDAATAESQYAVDQEQALNNFGLHLGPSGHLAFDVDVKNGDGEAELRKLEEELGPLPPTLTFGSASGGRHLIFEHTVESNRPLVPGLIDIRCRNGYIVCPGSSIDGNRYVVLVYMEPAKLPQRWIDYLSNLQVKAEVLDRPAIAQTDHPDEIEKAIKLLETVAPSIEGQGGANQLYKVCGKLYDLGITPDKRVELLLENWNESCVPPWSREELERTSNSCQNSAQNSFGCGTNEAAIASAKVDFTVVPVPPAEASLVRLESLGLDKLRYDRSTPPPRLPPVLWIDDTAVAKAGDLVGLYAQIKSGKSAFLAAMVASLLGSRPGSDLLGVRGTNERCGAVVWVDTEQSREDHFDLVERTLSRGGLAEAPPFLYSYCLTHVELKKREAYLVEIVKKAKRECGRICAIFVDGIGDLCTTSINDDVEPYRLVDRLYKMAGDENCPLVAVLHQNPMGKDRVTKPRGHLGTALQQRAASNLDLTKDPKTGVIGVCGERMRHGHIAVGAGPKFKWDDAKKMHVSSADTPAEVSREAEREFLEGLLPAGGRMRVGEVAAAAITAKLPFGFADENITRAVKELQKAIAGNAEFGIEDGEKVGPGYAKYLIRGAANGEIGSMSPVEALLS